MPNRLNPAAGLVLLAGFGLGLTAQTPAPAAGQNAPGQNIAGVVENASTGRPMAQASVTLVRLQGAMQPVSTTTTDAAGRYRFSQSEAGPYMVESDYQGVPYFATVTAGQSETNLQVYNVSHDAALMNVDAEIMVLQPDSGQLAVVNEYRIENNLAPPRTLASADKTGMFRFRVPAGAQVDMARMVGPDQMPLALQSQPTAEHGVYGLDTPLRPGETRIQISYRIPYAGLKAAITETPASPPAHFEVYVPNPMTFSSPTLVQLGAQDGYTVYGVASGPVAASESFQVAGNAPMPQAVQAAGDNAAAPGSVEGSASGSDDNSSAAAPPAAPVGAVPTPTFMERNRWTMLALLALAAAVGFGILLSQPSASTTVPVVTPPAPGSDDLSQLKNDLFLLEVQRHTGHLTEADYNRQRAQLNARLAHAAQSVLSPEKPSYTG